MIGLTAVEVAAVRPGRGLRLAAAGLAVLSGIASVTLVESHGPLAPFALIAGPVLLWCAVNSLELTLAGLLAAVVMFQRETLFEFSIPFFGGGLKPLDVALLLVFTGYVLRRVMGRTPATRLRDPVPALLLIFVGWSVLSAVHGLARGIPYKESLVELRPLLQYLLFIPIAAELGRDSIHRLVVLVLALSVAMAVRAIILFSQGVGESASYTGGVGVRVMDFEFSYLVVSMILAGALYMEGPRQRPVLLAVVGICFAGLVVTFYRAAFVGLGATAVFLWWVLTPRAVAAFGRAAAGAALAGVVLVPLVLTVKPGVLEPVLALQSRLASIGDYDRDPSAQHRLREWTAAAALIRQSPVVGNGLGTRIRFFSPMYDTKSNRTGYISNDFYTHNAYVWMTTKMGAVGVFIFLGLIGATLRLAIRFLNGREAGGDRAMVAGLAASLVAITTMSFFGPLFNTPNVAPFVGFLIGSLWALTRRAQPVGLPGKD